MTIDRFEIPGLAQYAYILSSEGYAAIIDPIRDVDPYLHFLQQKKLKLAAILETHIHADFAAGSIALAEATGAELAFSAYDQGEHYQYAMPHRALNNGDSVSFGKVRLEALHTPGHTPEHLSFVLFDTARSATEPMALFSGDFLFVGSLGRPDLLGEEAKLGLAHDLYKSVHERIAPLPDSIAVYPGHGAGSLCGAGMSEQAESTLGYERKTNPLFHLDEETFIKTILESVPPMPLYYPRMKQLNAQGAVSVMSLPGAKAISPSELAAMLEQRQTIILDLRRPEAFGGAHIPNAINIGAGQNLSLWAGWLLDPNKNIVLVADNGDSIESRRALVRVGLDNIAGYLEGGMPAWIDAGLHFTHTTQLSVHEVQQHTSDALVLDVRSNAEWNAGHIANAQHIMLGDLPARINTLPQTKSIITVCGSGYRSSIAASLIASFSRANVMSMNGGMAAWDHQQLPQQTAPASRS